MVDLARKAYWVLLRRPLQFLGLAFQYLRFRRTHFFQRFFLTPAQGIFLGENVRIQAITTFTAERPAARIEVGSDSIIYEKAHIEAYGKGEISIGPSCILGDVRIYSRARIAFGARVVTSWNVFIQDFDPHPVDPDLRRIQMEQMCEGFFPSYKKRGKPQKLDWNFPTAEVSIGDDVWIGAGVTILKGAKIGNGCVIAAGAIVPAGDYPPRSLLGGVPAKVLKSI